jgi:hypothetical protein
MTKLLKGILVIAGALVALAPILGCASTAPAVTRSNNRVQMPHYSFIAPPDRGWQLQRLEDPAETAILTHVAGSFAFAMKILRNTVTDDALKQATAKAVADDFRELERQTMIEEGVNRGLYRLEDVTLGEESIAGLTFYTMTYLVVRDSGTQRAALYLWFPKPERNEAFIVAHYSETTPPHSALFQPFTYLPDFKSTLQTLAMR